METLNKLLNSLNACINACDHCSASCLKEKDLEHMASCIRGDLACASVCRTTARLFQLGLGSSDALKLCIQICITCAMECEKHEHEHCQMCAKSCRECANECELYLSK